MNENDYRFPTKAEEHEIVKGLEDLFKDIETDSKSVAISGESLVNLLFKINPDAFGGSLENVERWLKENMERAERHESIKRILADFPTTMAH